MRKKVKNYSKLFFDTKNSTEQPNIGRVLTGEVTSKLISNPPRTKSVKQGMKVKEMNEVEGKQKNKTDQHEDFYINEIKGEKSHQKTVIWKKREDLKKTKRE